MKKILILSGLLIVFITNAQVPIIEWSKTSSFDFTNDILSTYYTQESITDISGNVYSVGAFSNTIDFDRGPNVSSLTATPNSNNGFISKHDPDGNFLWVKQFVGNSVDCRNISLDSAGNIYATGLGKSVDLDPGIGTVILNNSLDYTQGYVVKLNNNGDFVWGKIIECDNQLFTDYLEVDSSNNVFIAGGFQGTADFDTSNATVNKTSFGITDLFVLKLDSNGSFIWVYNAGSAENESFSGLKLDNLGNVFVTGRFATSFDFDPSPITTILTSNGGNDAFVLKLDQNGNLIWTKTISGALNENINRIVLDSNSNILLLGQFRGTVNFNNSTAITSNGDSDIFINKITNNGDFVWVKTFGGILSDSPNSIVLDNANNIIVNGAFTSSFDADPSANNFTITPNTSAVYGDCYILKLDADGNFNWIGAYEQTVSGRLTYRNGSLYLDGGIYGTGDLDFIGLTNTFSVGEYGGTVLVKYNMPALSDANFDFSDNLKVYPNPTSGNFNIEISQESIGAKVSVYNILGQNIKEFQLDGLTTNQNLGKGMYVIEIEKDGDKTSRKLIVN